MSQENEVEQEPLITGPGKVLKEKRESLNLTIEDIAGKLHLRPSIIEGLESDSYDPEVSTTFTKGYIRLYAKHLGLDAQPLLEQFDNLTNTSKQPAKLRSFSQKVAKQASDARLMMVTYFIITVIIGLSVVWWLQQDDDADSTFIPAAITTEEVAGSDPVVDSVDSSPTTQQVDEPLESFRNELVQSQNTDNELTVSEPIGSTPVAEDHEEAIASDSSSTTNSFSDTESVVSESQTDSDETLSVVVEPLNSDIPEDLTIDSQSTDTVEFQDASSQDETGLAAQINAPVTDLDTSLESIEQQTDDEAYELAQQNTAAQQAIDSGVVFTFAQDCWVSVTDATGEVVAIGIKAAGRVMPVPGTAPFEVVLGAPGGVSLTVDGVPYDMSQFPAGRTARFTVTKENASEIGG